MRKMIAAALLAAVACSGAAHAAGSEAFVGHTVKLKFGDGANGYFFGNADGTYAQVIEIKGKMVGGNGIWRRDGGKLCLQTDGRPKGLCWTYPALTAGHTVLGKADDGQTAQITLLKAP